MKALYVTRRYNEQNGEWGKISCIDTPMPKIVAPDDVLIHVAYASICGSDVHHVKDTVLHHLFGETPFRIGHEYSGIIVDSGPEAQKKGFFPGDAVTGNFVLECGHCPACRSGRREFCEHPYVSADAQAEYIVWKADQLYHLPEGTDLKEGALFEPFTIAVGAMERSDFQSGQSVFVQGAGSIGQMLIQLLSKTGASMIGAAVRTPLKQEMAMRMGADFVIDPLSEDVVKSALKKNGGKGFDIVFEASGNMECAEQALDLVRPGGTIVCVSYYLKEAELRIPLFEKLVARGIVLKGLQLAQNSWIHSMALFPKMDLLPLISDIYPLNESDRAYGELIKGKKLKILFDCSKE